MSDFKAMAAVHMIVKLRSPSLGGLQLHSSHKMNLEATEIDYYSIELLCIKYI